MCSINRRLLIKQLLFNWNLVKVNGRLISSEIEQKGIKMKRFYVLHHLELLGEFINIFNSYFFIFVAFFTAFFVSLSVTDKNESNLAQLSF